MRYDSGSLLAQGDGTDPDDDVRSAALDAELAAADVRAKNAETPTRTEVGIPALGGRRVSVHAADPAVVAHAVRRLPQTPGVSCEPFQDEVGPRIDRRADQVDAVRLNDVREPGIAAQASRAAAEVGGGHRPRTGCGS